MAARFLSLLCSARVLCVFVDLCAFVLDDSTLSILPQQCQF
jgi:hypothetical protein